MYKSVKTALMALTVFAVGTGVAFSENLVLNPSFENWTDDDADNWTRTGTVSGVVKDTIRYSSGATSVRFDTLTTALTGRGIISDLFSIKKVSCNSLTGWSCAVNNASKFQKDCCIIEPGISLKPISVQILLPQSTV